MVDMGVDSVLQSHRAARVAVMLADQVGAALAGGSRRNGSEATA